MDAKTLSAYLRELAKEDQKRLVDLSLELKSVKNFNKKLSIIKPVAKACQEAAESMVKVIKKSGIKPTISNIGEDASNAIILITLHSYIKIMDDVYKMFDELDTDAKDIPLNYLAVLIDRIELIKNRKQIFATITYEYNNQEFFVPVKNLEELNFRREKYLLPNCDIAKIRKKQRALSEAQYLLDYAFMDKKIV